MSVWTQRAGRAGRDLSIQAEAVLVAEASMFQIKKQSRTSKTAGQMATADVDDGEVVYGKKVNPDVRAWIVDSCRRVNSNKYFDGPPLVHGECASHSILS